LIDPRYPLLGIAGAFLGISAFLPTAYQKKKPQAPAKAKPSFDSTVKPFLSKYCLTCHAGPRPPAHVQLGDAKSIDDILRDTALWDRVARNISSSHMPPEGMPKPTESEREAIVTLLQTSISGNCKIKDPGKVTMRRLNRQEYNNTIRDLTGLDLHLAEDFPSDDVGYGFDNIGDVLSISPLLMEKYLRAAEVVAQRAIVVPDNKPSRFDGERVKTTNGVNVAEGNSLFFFSNGQAYIDQYMTMAGTYHVRASAYGQQAGSESAKMGLLIDGKQVQEFDVAAVEAHPQIYEASIELDAGKHRIALAFLNDYYKPGKPPEDRNLIVKFFELSKPPLKAASLPESHSAIIFVHPDGANWKPAAQQIISRFALRAFRRPPTTTEVSRLMQLAEYVIKDGQPFEKAIQLCVQAVLSSPNFLFRVETDTQAQNLNGYELASRLSYFLWGSMPDSELFSLAQSGSLQKPEVLKSQVKRMLKDPRISALADNFAEEWLNLRKLALINPDPAQFGDFSESLRSAMLKETKLFFDGVVQNDRSVIDFLNAKYTYINGPLAKHYGIEGVDGDEFRKVSLTGTPRQGLLTQASILTLTSNPTRTSPVKRGKWILEQILNAPLPPPPPNVGVLPDDGKQMAAASLRQKMEVHRRNPMCATCHKKMDPLGFSLENFDAVGRWRSKDGKDVIDASGVLPDGTKFSGPTELSTLLLKQKKDFIEGLSEKLLTYAIGRGVEPYDKCSVDEISQSCASNSYHFSSLINAIVLSDPFRKKRVSGGKSK